MRDRLNGKQRRKLLQGQLTVLRIDLFPDSDSFYNYIPHFPSERSN